MKVNTYPGDRMVYIELVDAAESADSEEVSRGLVIDYDIAGRPVGIEIDVDAILARPALSELRD